MQDICHPTDPRQGSICLWPWPWPFFCLWPKPCFWPRSRALLRIQCSVEPMESSSPSASACGKKTGERHSSSDADSCPCWNSSSRAYSSYRSWTWTCFLNCRAMQPQVGLPRVGLIPLEWGQVQMADLRAPIPYGPMTAAGLPP